MDKEINNNGFDYVDLGLPSGTLWATCNVGASKPSDAGLYFQWGDIKGYTKEQVETGDGQKKFASDWSDYKWRLSGDRWDNIAFTKYTTTGATLDLEDDAANAYMGGDWHMPTPEQIQELLDNTSSEWTTLDGVDGRLFISKKDDSKSIFIPAVGTSLDGSIINSGEFGVVWTSLLNTGKVSDGQSLFFDSDGVILYSDIASRCGGFSVRGVIDKKRDNFKEKKSNMNEKLNLVEILKNVPTGTKLWSPIIGECELVGVFEKWLYPIKCEKSGDIDFWCFSSDGKYDSFDDAECVLFPSKENRDWSTFKVPNKHKHFEQYQKVLVKEYCGDRVWVPELYGYYNTSSKMHYLVGTNWTVSEDDNIIPYEGNEDKVGKPVE